MINIQFPNDNEKWIPEAHARIYEQYAEHAAWYSGDSTQLSNFYSSKRFTPMGNGRFWGENIGVNDHRSVIHVPLAGDIATFSSDLLFAATPEITIPEAYQENSTGRARAQQADARLQQIMERGGVMTRLLEAGETSAAMGGVFLKPTWDKEIADVPILSVAQPDNAIPYFEHGFLTGVLFHKELIRDGSKVYRLLELHTNGWIENALYIGDDFGLGRRVPLTYMSETENIEPYIDTQIPTVLARYIPNKRPHKRFRGTALGMSDIQGAESLLDSLDLTMTSWIRDIVLGRARLHVPEQLLKNHGNGRVAFDGGQELYVELDIDATMLEGQSPLTATQFQIRTNEHQATATELISKILHMAGYAPQSFGMQLEGSSAISTESHEIRQRKTMITKQKKEQLYRGPIAETLELMLLIDNIHLGNTTPTEFRPNVAFSDTLGQTMSAVSKTVQMLQTAQSASIQTRVEMLHPDWSVEEIAAEVERIKEETGLNVESPINIGGIPRL